MTSRLTITTLLISTLVSLSTAQFGPRPNHYVHPHEVVANAKRVEAALPSLMAAKDDIDALKNVFDPEEVFRQASHMGHTISDKCANETLFLLEMIGSGSNETWPLKIIDSWAKPEAGLLELNLQWLGNFDECVDTKSAQPNISTYYKPMIFNGKYCTVGATLGSATMSFGVPAGISVGTCFPSGCSEKDISSIVATLMEAVHSNTTLNVACQETDMPLSNGAIVTIVVYSIMAAICLMGTLYDFYRIMTTPKKVEEHQMTNGGVVNEVDTRDTAVLMPPLEYKTISKPSTIGELLMCFSLYTNGYKLLSTKQPAGSLNCINGIRFISMTWVILGHTLVFSITSIENFLTVTTWMKRFTFGVIDNATVSVDSFFVLSALLTTFLMLRDLERRKPGIIQFLISVPVMYLHRYIRLTPAYGFMILFYTTLLLYFYNGPLKPPHTNVADAFCKTNWWGAIFYLNNVIEPSKMCAGWGWYLSNDFQFFLVTPFVVLLMYITPIGGLVTAIVMVITSAGAATGISAQEDFGMGITGARNPADTTAEVQKHYMTDYYFAPWARYQSFGVGVIFGFILWRMHGKIRLPTIVNLSLWAMSALLMLLIMYGPYQVNSGQRIASAAEAAIFNGWSRVAWSVALGYIILSCCLGQGGWVNEFLSWPGFVPLSRMTYCAYLVHPVIITLFNAANKNKIIWTDFTMISQNASYITLSYAVAFLFSLMFEAPFMLIDKKFLTGKLSKKLN